MKIKLRVHFAGPGFSAAPGDEIERPDEEAFRLIQKGYAVALSPLPPRETAVPKPVLETRAPEPAPAPAPPKRPDHDGDGKVGGSKKRKRR